MDTASKVNNRLDKFMDQNNLGRQKLENKLEDLSLQMQDVRATLKIIMEQLGVQHHHPPPPIKPPSPGKNTNILETSNVQCINMEKQEVEKSSIQCFNIGEEVEEEKRTTNQIPKIINEATMQHTNSVSYLDQAKGKSTS
ncbi:hypothetical protein AgCh_022126 [Apium graveolens]